jgi:hypothetical protein
MFAPSTDFTLATITLPDGCQAPDTAPVIAAAVAAARSPKERQGFDRFTLRVDGQVLRTDRRDTLAKWMSSIVSGAKCSVFRNMGQGATIDFDS